MRLPRITLTWRALRRKTAVASRHVNRRRGAHRAPRTSAVPGRRTAVGGAVAVLALTATTATAVDSGPVQAEATAPTVPVTIAGTATTSPPDPPDPLVVVSTDPTVVEATEALERADEAAAHGDDEADRIAKRAAKVTRLLADQIPARPAAAASRSSDRAAVVPPEETATAETTTAETTEDAADTEQTEAADKAEDAAATGTTPVVDDAPQMVEATPVPDPAQIFPAAAADAAEVESADSGESETDGESTSTAAGAVPVAAAATTATVPADPERLAAATESLEALVEKVGNEAAEVKAAPEEPAKEKKATTPSGVLAEQVAAAKKAAAALEKYVDSTAGHANGQIAADALSTLKFDSKEQLRTDAARQLERLNAAYKAEFGTNLQINDSYRSYDAQVSMKASRGHMAATPGYSNHGWGVAVDLGGGVENFGTAQHEWMRENAPKFGWGNPDWAQADGRKPEGWHWEYTPLT